jgi:hypothetical protein
MVSEAKRGDAEVAEAENSSVREIVGVDSFDFVIGGGCDADPVIEHELRKVAAIDQDDLGFNPG